MIKIDVKIVPSRKQYLKLSFRPNFLRKEQVPNKPIRIEKIKCRINLNKPVHIRAVILEKNKNHMYTFHYK